MLPQDLKAFEAMGADIHIEQGYVKAAALRGLRGAEISFPFVSVGATEHAMLAAVLARGDTVIRNAAREPEIIDLADCLNAIGARIEGAGTGEIQIQGAREHNLKGIDVSIPRERFVVITGPSGSGKSSLAKDTLYAEGHRRYVECLSAEARQ